MLEWMESQQLRMECQAGLNTGEARHALARAVFAHSQDRIHDRSHDAQQKRVMALNVVIAAIVYWNTSYIEKAANHLRRERRLPEANLEAITWNKPCCTSLGTRPLPFARELSSRLPSAMECLFLTVPGSISESNSDREGELHGQFERYGSLPRAEGCRRVCEQGLSSQSAAANSGQSRYRPASIQSDTRRAASCTESRARCAYRAVV